MAKNLGRDMPEATVSPLTGMSVETLDALFRANARAAQLWFNSWTRVAAEIGSFTTKRWERDAELVGRICGCKNPVDVLEVQTEFAERALKDYMQETAKLASMETEAVTQEAEEIEKGVREAPAIAASSRASVRATGKRAATH